MCSVFPCLDFGLSPIVKPLSGNPIRIKAKKGRTSWRSSGKKLPKDFGPGSEKL